MTTIIRISLVSVIRMGIVIQGSQYGSGLGSFGSKLGSMVKRHNLHMRSSPATATTVFIKGNSR